MHRGAPPGSACGPRCRRHIRADPVDLRLDLGFDPDRTGFHVEGLVYRADGSPVKGLNPRNQWVRVARLGGRRRGGRAVRGGGVQPPAARRWRLRLPAVAAGRPGHRRSRGPLPHRARRARRLRGGGLGAAAGPRGARPARRRARGVRRPALAGPARHRPVPRPPRRQRHRGHGGRGARRARRGARGPRPGQRPPHLGGRPRPHRLRLAVAGARDGAQGGPHLLQRGLAHGRPPRARLRHVLGPAVRLAQGAPPRGLGRGGRPGARGPLRARGRHVGRVRHQHARRRGPGPAAEPRQAVLPRRVRHRDPRGVAARLLRLHRRPAAAHRAVGFAVVPHPEDLLEHHQPLPAPHLPVGGPRRHPRLHALPAGRHLRLRGVRRRGGARGPQLLRQGGGHPLAAALRLG